MRRIALARVLTFLLVGAVIGVSAIAGYLLSTNASSGANSTASTTTYSSGYTCIGSTTTAVMRNGSQFFVQTCSITRVVLDAQGCYQYSNGSALCAKGAPGGSVADTFLNGTTIITYPNGTKVSCDPARGIGPCLMGVP